MGDRSEIVVILDRSGSMQSAKSDHEGGLNSFVQDQKGLAGDVRFTLVQFDSEEPCDIVYDGVPIQDVAKCALIPRGGTPLLDAIGKAVAHVAARVDTLTVKPQQVVVMVITDGEENSSREWTLPRIKQLIQEREGPHGWKFLFLGANVDAFSEAGRLGIAMASSMQFAQNPQSVNAAYHATSQNMMSARQAFAGGASQVGAYRNYTYTDEQRTSVAGGTQGTTSTNKE